MLPETCLIRHEQMQSLSLTSLGLAADSLGVLAFGDSPSTLSKVSPSAGWISGMEVCTFKPLALPLPFPPGASEASFELLEARFNSGRSRLS